MDYPRPLTVGIVDVAVSVTVVVWTTVRVGGGAAVVWITVVVWVDEPPPPCAAAKASAGDILIKTHVGVRRKCALCVSRCNPR